jgi:ribonuclease BN (tRNA processing enzyme)
MSLNVILLGTGVGIPQDDRSQSAILIQSKKSVLFDCGAGTLIRLTQAGVDVRDLEGVFLTHLHLDHVADLLPLQNARYLLGARPVPTYGPPGTRRWLSAVQGAYPYLEKMEAGAEELYPGDELSFQDLKIASAGARHSVTAMAYRVTSGFMSMAYSGDTEPTVEVANLASGADLLVHECSFPEPYEITNHSTPRKIGALIENVGRIVLTHLYPQARGHEVEMVRDVKASLREDIPVEVGRDLQVISL